jgi:outer membrane protein TolC
LATSPLLPQAGIGLDGRIIDEGRAAATPPFLSQRALAGFAGLSQVVYDEKLWADRSIEKSIQSSRQLDFETLELDIIRDAATAYLSVLRAKTFETVQRENLALTRSNFELAQIRFSVGAADASEVYRWENQIANDRQALIDAAAFTQQVAIELRRMLNRPLDEDFETQETDLSDPSLVTSQDVLRPYLANPLAFARFQQFLAMEAIAASPELASLRSLEQARDRALASATRSFFLPSLTLDAGLNSFLARGGELGTLPPGSSSLSNTQWDVGLVLSYPLFTGLARSAEQSRAREQLSEIQIQVEAATDRIEQRLRSTLYALGAAATSIQLSRQAADAAINNYAVVREAYARGVGNIIVLLDAQQSSVIAEERAATAQFDFLIELMNVERSIGRFYFFASQDDFEHFVQRLEAFFQSGT